MTESSTPKILVGVDGSERNRAALSWAVQEAAARDSELIAVHAWHLPSLVYYAPGYLPIASDEMVEESADLLHAAVAGIPGHDAVKIEMRALQGRPQTVLSRIAAEPSVGLVVVGTRGHGSATGLLLGSVSHSLSHHCPKPLVIVPGPAHGIGTTAPVRRVLVGVDGSDGSVAALRWAAEEAAIHGAELEVVTAWSRSAAGPARHAEPSSGEGTGVAAEYVLKQSVGRVAMGDVRLDCTASEGYAPTVLLDSAAGADLLVVGAPRRDLATEFILGSTSHQVAHRSPIPVVIVPSEGPVHDHPAIEEMSRDECLELLRSTVVGRIGGSADGRPFVLPVNYAVDGDRVVFRTSPGTKLMGSDFARVAFEIDGFDPNDHGGWSVVVEGVASDISDMVDDLSMKLRVLDLQPWSPGEKSHWVAIVPESVTGRRVRPRQATSDSPPR